LFSKLVYSFSKQSLSLFNTIQTPGLTLVMCRSSNLVAAAPLSLHLLLGNTLRVKGADAEEVDIIREVLKSRWPYQITQDAEITTQVSEHDTIDDLQTRDTSTSEKEEDGKEKETEDTKQMKVMNWEWKVRRFPWKVSYGARLWDRAVERVGVLLPLPPPRHQDLESAKSIILFSIKELSERGWKYTGSVNNDDNETILYFLR